MALDSQKRTVADQGVEREEFVVTFSNGALDQLEQLKSFFKMQDEEEVVRMAISMLQSIKDRESAKEQRIN